MKQKINLNRVEIYTDVAHKECMVVDIREQLANCIYQAGRGLPAHALALKIYNADGDIECDERDFAIIQEVAQERCSPNVIDALKHVIETAKPVETKK